LLTTATLLAWTRLKMPDLDAGNLVRAQELASSAGTAARCAGAGVLFGLCVLCRPTAWVWGGLGLMWLVWGQRRPHIAQHVGIGDRGWEQVFALVAGIAVVVAPWVIRNTVVFGRPILTTTHGGYTLLLGNNPEFYAEVVHQPWGTTWDGSHGGGQAAWAKRLQARLEAEGVRGELATDRSLSAEARRHIIAQPLSFLQACLLRLARFWNGVPQGSAAAGLPGKVLIVLGLWYAAEYLLALRGLWKVIQGREAQWTLAVLLVLAFTAVHLIYWSNVRMRAPVMPVVTLLAAHGLKPRARQLL
jgi:hypothetical protein